MRIISRQLKDIIKNQIIVIQGEGWEVVTNAFKRLENSSFTSNSVAANGGAMRPSLDKREIITLS